MIKPKIIRSEAGKYTPEFCQLVKDFCDAELQSVYQFSGYYVPRELLQVFYDRRHDFVEVITEIKQCVERFEKSKKL